MTVYHVTTAEAAARIDAEGFCDSAGYYDPATDRTGVWVSDTPVPATKMESPVVFAIDAPPAAIAQYAWRRAGTDHVMWFLPAQLLNTFARSRIAR